MKGILLAGGNGTRLYPLTRVACKQLLPIYDKPMIFYPLSTLIYLGLTEILIVSSPEDLPVIQALLGDGSRYGISLTYKVQEKPNGISEVFIIAEDFIGRDSAALILGDNIFYGPNFSNYMGLKNLDQHDQGAIILTYHVNNPQRYGVAEYNNEGIVVSIEEKPENPKSNWAVTGLYFYDNQVVDIAKSLVPSKRGELEITDINKIYLKNNNLKAQSLQRGFAWIDTGTPDSLLEAGNFVQTIQQRQGLKIGCIEEICYRKKLIDTEQFLELALSYNTDSEYRKYMLYIADEIQREKSEKRSQKNEYANAIT